MAPKLIKLETKPEGKKPNTLFFPPGVKIVTWPTLHVQYYKDKKKK